MDWHRQTIIQARTGKISHCCQNGGTQGIENMKKQNDTSEEMVTECNRLTLAETKAKILEALDKRIDLDADLHAETKYENLQIFISLALDTAWEDFKGVVKMEKDEAGRVAGIKAPEEEPYFIAGFEEAIDELDKRIKDYED